MVNITMLMKMVHTKENFAITVNGQLLYFGKDGALTSSSTYSFHTRNNKYC